MDFVRSEFGTNEPLPVEHFCPHFLAGLLCVCAANRPKSENKSVHLAEVYFLQNPYFSVALKNLSQDFKNSFCIGCR